MFVSKRTLAVLAAVLAVAVITTGAFAVSRHPAPRPAAASGSAPASDAVTVSGTGKVQGTPDVLSLMAGVDVTRPTIDAALKAANAAADRLIKALRNDGVARKDIQTSNFSINIQYDYPNGSSPVLKGYQVTNGIVAKVRKLSTAGRVISDAATASGNDVRINGIQFDLEDNTALVSAARDRAFGDAKDKAQQYAKLSGRSLGRVISVSEQTTSNPPPPIAYDAVTSKQALAVPAPAPIEPGQQDVSVLVTVVWELA